MELQAEAERRKRAQILESEGTSQAKVNVAEARKQEQILGAEALQTEVVLVAEARKKEVVLAAEGIQALIPQPKSAYLATLWNFALHAKDSLAILRNMVKLTEFSILPAGSLWGF